MKSCWDCDELIETPDGLVCQKYAILMYDREFLEKYNLLQAWREKREKRKHKWW